MLRAKLNSTPSAFSSSSVYCFSRSSDRVLASNSLKSIGLLRKSSAPALMPLMRSPVAESPVIRTTGVRRVAGVALIRRQTSKPSTPGITISRRIRSGRNDAHSVSAESPLLTSRTSNPSRRNSVASAIRAADSSSTMRILSNIVSVFFALRSRRRNEALGAGRSIPPGTRT